MFLTLIIIMHFYANHILAVKKSDNNKALL